MKYDPDIHKRRSVRLEGYDYSQAGAYFITICVQNRQPLLGTIIDDGVILNSAGGMVTRLWHELKHKYQEIQLDQYVVMPDHFHGIIQIQGEHIGLPLREIVRWFKTMTTNEYIRNAKENGWIAFDKRLWQRNYYEHIIRDEESLREIREYIVANPANWTHPTGTPVGPTARGRPTNNGRTRRSAPTKSKLWRFINDLT